MFLHSNRNNRLLTHLICHLCRLVAWSRSRRVDCSWEQADQPSQGNDLVIPPSFSASQYFPGPAVQQDAHDVSL
jgi:hypothetical protein